MLFTTTVIACVLGGGASVAKLDWEDCGDSDTHVIITDLAPTDLPLGSTTTVTGSGILDETQDGGSFKFKATLAGVPVTTGEGDLCKGADLTLPLGVGKITIKPLACPVEAGDAAVILDITLASLLTQDVNSLVKVDLTAATTTGDKLFCMKINVDTPKQLLAAEKDPCCVSCSEPLKKYYSVDVKGGFCGEACMDPSKFNLYKIFEKNLTLADSESPCKDQFTPVGTHYTEYSDTVTHGVPGLLAVTLDLYGPGPELSLEDNTCSAAIGHCGRAYQTCCITYGAQGYPCGCSLTDGSGSSIGDCGTCGAAYQLCCDGFKAEGDPCNCNVAGVFTGFSV